MSAYVTDQSAVAPIVRDRVHDILGRSASYWELPEHRRRDLADDMVKVAEYIVGGRSGESVPRSATLAGTSAVEAFRRDRDPGFARAARSGAAAYTDMVREVNFPAFVAGLIDGVFNAIVTTSIKQMDAYAELVKNVAKSVDDFMKDNVSENSARDYLANKYPDQLEVDTGGEKPVLKPKEGADDSDLPDFFKDLGLSQPVSSLDEETTEEVLVPAARKRMAMDRQQLLATMVLMGINRLIVTDGHIQASCTFTLDTKDSLTRHYDRAEDFDFNSKYSEKGTGTWYNSNATYDYSNNAQFKVSTHQSGDQTQSVDMHAKLGGKVQVNFKSETFPLEKMADVLQMNQIQEKAPAGLRPPAPGAPAPEALPPAPAAPAR